IHWSVAEKETYPIVTALRRLRHYLSLGHFTVITDHRNLVFIFGNASRSKTIADRLERWRSELDGFYFSIQHIEGKLNFWPDLLSRWQVKSISPVRFRQSSAVEPQPDVVEPFLDEVELIEGAIRGTVDLFDDV